MPKPINPFDVRELVRKGHVLPLLLNQQNTAAFIGVSESLLKVWIQDGVFPVRPFKNGWYRRIDVETYINQPIEKTDDELVDEIYSDFQTEMGSHHRKEGRDFGAAGSNALNG